MANYRANDVIRLTRKAVGLSQEAISEGICSVETFSRIERGKTKIKGDTYKKIMERMERNTDINKKFQKCDVPDKCYPVNKIYKLSELKKRNIYFEPNVYFEDRLFTAQVLINLKTLVTVPNTYYNYWTNPNSIVKTKSKKKLKDSQYTKEKLMKYLKENNVNLDHYYTKIKKFKILGLTFLKIKYYKYKKELIFLNQIKFQIKN